MANRARRSPPRIAVVLQTWSRLAEGATEGILRYDRRYGPYQLRDVIYHNDEEIAPLVRRAQPDALLTSLNLTAYQRVVDDLPDVPTVNINADRVAPEVGTVGTDDEAVICMVLEHFRTSGYARIAFAGREGLPGSLRREKLLRTRLGGQGKLPAFHFPYPGDDPSAQQTLNNELDRWLTRLEKPVGVVTWNGLVALALSEACGRLGCETPADVGILSFVDERACLFAEPYISAVEVDGERLGYEAMKMLARILRGKPAPERPVLVEPRQIIARGSTGPLDPEDDDIARALRFIEGHACQGIAVDDVVKTMQTMSRTKFYAEFTQRTGCSPAQHIRRRKIEQAKIHLAQTHLAVTRLAGMCGFGSPTQFGDTFKREVGMTPWQYRQQHQE